MRSVVTTPRDLELFNYLSKLRCLSAEQIAVLIYPQFDEGGRLDIKKTRKAAYNRVWRLARAGYISSSQAIDHRGRYCYVYFLAPDGAQAIKDTREEENFLQPRTMDRKINNLQTRGAHDLLVNDILSQLVLLSKTDETFYMADWSGDRDLRLHIGQDSKKIFDPDLYISCSNGGSSIPMFIELDRGTHSKAILRRKIHRFFQYYATAGHVRDFELDAFPRSCWITTDKARIRTINACIQEAKRNYSGPKSGQIQHFPFWSTTIDAIEPDALGEGRISDQILKNIWITHEGTNNASPFVF